MLSLLRWTDLRWDFKEVLADLFCIIAVGLADEPDGIRQQHILPYGTFHTVGYVKLRKDGMNGTVLFVFPKETSGSPKIELLEVSKTNCCLARKKGVS
ncbi:MAG: hypothetical protein J6Y60_08795 [Treponema sp.]|nr:hypothetical protein [Treponema sp.]